MTRVQFQNYVMITRDLILYCWRTMSIIFLNKNPIKLGKALDKRYFMWYNIVVQENLERTRENE